MCCQHSAEDIDFCHPDCPVLCAASIHALGQRHSLRNAKYLLSCGLRMLLCFSLALLSVEIQAFDRRLFLRIYFGDTHPRMCIWCCFDRIISLRSPLLIICQQSRREDAFHHLRIEHWAASQESITRRRYPTACEGVLLVYDAVTENKELVLLCDCPLKPAQTAKAIDICPARRSPCIETRVKAALRSRDLGAGTGRLLVGKAAQVQQ